MARLMKSTPQGQMEMSKDEEVAFLAEQEAFNAPTPATIAAHRWQVENGGMTVEKVPIKTDTESRTNLIAAFIMASADPAYTSKWKAADGKFYTLDSAAIISIGYALRAFVQKCFDTEAMITESLGKYKTVEDANAAFDNAMEAT